MNWLALDIGGANIKVADGKGFARSVHFALWRFPARLPQELRTVIAEAPRSDHLAVTMTGELADCFETKAAGVQFILNAVREAADGRHTRVYLVDGKLVSPQVAAQRPHQAAASNWHALARFCGRFAASGGGLLIDIGSTTCDLIPLWDGEPRAQGVTDTQRLLRGELLYTGVERTPVCAVARRVSYRGQECPVASEVFASMADAYLILGDLSETHDVVATADGRPFTKAAARSRLGRMLGADHEEFHHRDAVVMAEALAEAQAQMVIDAIKHVTAEFSAAPGTIILSGHGEFLARRALAALPWGAHLVSLAKELGVDVSRSATAHALAVLAAEAAAA